jgi:SNF2 family DNA or RNA helicase
VGSAHLLTHVNATAARVQAISFIAALLGKQGTPQDALPRSFAAFRRQRQQERQQRTQLRDDRDDSDNDLLGHDAAAAGGGGGGDGDAEDAGSSVRWPVLVVCPTSVLDNWMRELNMWGTFKVSIWQGLCAACLKRDSELVACVPSG